MHSQSARQCCAVEILRCLGGCREFNREAVDITRYRSAAQQQEETGDVGKVLCSLPVLYPRGESGSQEVKVERIRSPLSTGPTGGVSRYKTPKGSPAAPGMGSTRNALWGSMGNSSLLVWAEENPTFPSRKGPEENPRSWFSPGYPSVRA
ncbi:hypothetical protein DL95DRAFT_404037 [Leptodontidium sp. 2 PMI_412]|nr:hypothetical protein DL95DRAFT_404037 [Leptodontidium sp. 2 PMI_412]